MFFLRQNVLFPPNTIQCPGDSFLSFSILSEKGSDVTAVLAAYAAFASKHGIRKGKIKS